ncbi:MAG: sigma-54 dependent transcriptional regulator [Myxococcota bacterium]|nr:sigma-54 dependent transcriptional regulator [Myxococcota bacterium]
MLVVDDDPPVLRALRRMLSSSEFCVHTAESGQAALELCSRRSFDVALVDLMLPEMSGLDLLDRLRRTDSGIEVIMMTGYGAVPDAVAALRSGARDFFVKPIEDSEQLLRAVRQAMERRGRAGWPMEAPGEFSGLIGTSPRMRRLQQTIEAVAPSRAAVLIQGESGTGKELVARALHARSGRKGPFVAVNCSALPESLLESELFGHARGAFTGARGAKRGLFLAAQGGTLLLDEIGDLPLGVQAKLLRALQEGEVRPLGLDQPIQVDVRIVAATHVDLVEAQARGTFREDLYYRLAVITLEVPPLRERREDIPALAHHFLRRAAARSGRKVSGFDEAALQLLCAYRWGGNVRELENVIERAVVLGEGPLITVADLPPALHQQELPPAAPDPPHLRLDYAQARQAALLAFERAYMTGLLRRCRGNISEAARRAGLDRANLRRVLRRCGVRAEDFRDQVVSLALDDPEQAEAPRAGAEAQQDRVRTP